MRSNSILREPLVHFLVLGAALFLYWRWTGGGAGTGSTRILVTAGQVEHLAAGFKESRRRLPTAEELKAQLDDWVREELAVREAMAMGLDRDDTIVRRRLQQKLEFLLADDAGPAPTDPELQAFMAAHADDFRIDPRISLRQVTVSRERHGTSAESDARSLLARLQAEGPGARIDELGDPSQLPQEVPLSPLRDVASLFGPDFSATVNALAPGTWAGPIESSVGLHLVLVRERAEGSLPDLAAVRAEVERDFLAERRSHQRSAMYERLLAKYTVVIQAPAAGSTGATATKGGS